MRGRQGQQRQQQQLKRPKRKRQQQRQQQQRSARQQQCRYQSLLGVSLWLVLGLQALQLPQCSRWAVGMTHGHTFFAV
jgi:hypothetical protein